MTTNFWKGLNISNEDYPELNSSLVTLLKNLISEQKLPTTYLDTISNSIYPLSCKINTYTTNKKGTLVIGINGGQGSGKSTTSFFIKTILKEVFNKNTVIISIDDIYKTRHERKYMSENIHPLFITRGVPGTHDVQLGINTITSLKNNNLPVEIPQFDKSIDDRCEQKKWLNIDELTDIIILEGWCVGVTPQNNNDIKKAANSLEETEDSETIWRTYVNNAIKSEYKMLFDLLDKLIMLKIPSFEKVVEWRSLQEKKLAESRKEGNKIMTSEEIIRFVSHYERLTRHMLQTLPKTSDIVIGINNNHDMESVHTN